MPANVTPFGQTAAGQTVAAIRIGSADLAVTILSFGAALQDLRLTGVPHSLTLGGPDMAAYEGPMGYFGTIVGPVANRLAGSQAWIAGHLYRFPANEGTTLLHGGATGTQARVWSVEDTTETSLRLTLTLEDGDDGFPGRRQITADYSVAGSTLTLRLSATTDAPTLMNLASHSYWNLTGTPTTAGHRLTVAADAYLPTDAANIPTGEQRPVTGAFNLRQPRRIDGTEGWDHNFCLCPAPRALTDVATLTGGQVAMTLATTEPGLQVYDGRGIGTGPFGGHSGRPYGPFAALALEAQLWPDAPNQSGFPPVTLDPGETYRQETQWRFAKVQVRSQMPEE
jgi:aldose 1-epimerase